MHATYEQQTALATVLGLLGVDISDLDYEQQAALATVLGLLGVDISDLDYEQQAALATVLGLLGVDISDLDYDAMCEWLATETEMRAAARRARAEEVTRNCHTLARFARDNAPLLLALHECACEHDGAADWLDHAAERARVHLLLARRGRPAP